MPHESVAGADAGKVFLKADDKKARQNKCHQVNNYCQIKPHNASNSGFKKPLAF